ncbi:MAG: hypothetical protein NTX03_05190 [Bacteroidetes bacterium]|nr:hypothetical protein [Bacteroidota bacterium]
MMDDLGIRFGRDHSFIFEHFIIDEILFDETDDITLYTRVMYYEEEYFCTFGLGFDQLNVILRSMKSISNPIATALAEKLEQEEMPIPSTINVKEIYNLRLETTLFELTDDEDEEDDEDFSADDSDENRGEYIAYAFIVEEIIPLKKKKTS